jgi:hypothetical protein
LNVIVFFPVRDGDTVKHYRIRQLDDGGFFIARRATFPMLSDLVNHYRGDADGLCVNLRKPCSQVSNFPYLMPPCSTDRCSITAMRCGQLIDYLIT